jgi:hypothetical protein
MVADPLDTARQDVFEGRRRLASQEQLIDDLLRTDCTSLLPIATRLLSSTFRNFHPLRDYVAVQKMSSAAINSRARSSGRMARPRGPPLIHLSFQSDQ